MPQETTPNKIGIATATIIGMNAMIGSGIFTVPATLASFVGPAGIFAYGFVIISVWCMAFSLARLAQLFPQEGSFYAYAKQWGGHSAGMIAGTSYMIGLLIAMGLLAQTAGYYIHSVFPLYSSYAFGFIALMSLIVLNMFGVVLSQLGQHILITFTLFPLIAISTMCLFKADINNVLPLPPFTLIDVLKATRIVIFGFLGFECAASLFNIIENPQRNLPRAISYSIIIVSIVYLFFVTALMLSTPLAYFTNPHMPISETLRYVFPHNIWIIGVIHFTILSAILGTIHSMIWSSSELLISLTNKMRNNAHTKISRKIAVALVGLCIFLTFHFITNINLFFSLTALFIINAFILSMITLLPIKQKFLHFCITIVGMITAFAIVFFACQDLIENCDTFF